MAKQEVIAMLLAGGHGSRLGVLTDSIAKPAVPFGSRYRIIDFPLSNCTNSGIETVGVLTQYQPLDLNAYVGNGHPWDLDRNNGGLTILPPYQSVSRSDWYKGTANSIYQNIPFIDRYNPSYVVVLSGDHIYKMDYRKMLQDHIANKADCTIAVIEVPWEEASRFGIMNTDEEGTIVEFEEKPEKPKNNLASMGVYCFSWEVLRAELIADEQDPKSDNDFGKNIIPRMFKKGRNLVAHTFKGYWKDVGTFYSLWEANMDILDKPKEIDLSDSTWRIYGRNPIRPSHFVADGAVVERSVLTDGDEIYGKVIHSVISNSVIVEEGAEVRDSFLMPGVVVKKGAQLNRCIVGMHTTIGENTVLGHSRDDNDERYIHKLCTDGITVVQNDITLKEGAIIAPNSMVRLLENEQDNDLIQVALDEGERS